MRKKLELAKKHKYSCQLETSGLARHIFIEYEDDQILLLDPNYVFHALAFEMASREDAFS